MSCSADDPFYGAPGARLPRRNSRVRGRIQKFHGAEAARIDRLTQQQHTDTRVVVKYDAHLAPTYIHDSLANLPTFGVNEKSEFPLGRGSAHRL
jgi:hypothetical protein